MHLFLIGMPASGKTTLGRALAAHFGLVFLDLDAAIVARAGQSIKAIFATHGEAYFRELEAHTLRQVVAAGGGALVPNGPLVLATGGGTPCFHNNMAWLNAHGLTLWLDVPVPALAARLPDTANEHTGSGRPLLAAAGAGAEAWLHETLTRRRGFYAQARLRCAGAACTVAAVAAQVQAAGFGPAPTQLAPEA